MMYEKKKTTVLRRLEALLLVLCMALSLCPALVGTVYAFGEEAMDKLVNWGVVGGYPDGNTHPERNLTRAEFVAMVNRAYGYTKPGPTPFRDVAVNAWYYDDIGIAYNANYFGGVSPRMAAPDTPLTREQAMVLLARNMRLDPVGGEVVEFSDGRNFADWSRGYARAAAQMGLIGGYGDGSYRPQNNITRGEMATMLGRALGTLINKPGTHTLSDTYGNVTISSTGTTLKDSTIAGNLYITGGLDLGDVTLDNVRVLGDIIVAGGGESHSGEDSIILRNVVADSLLVDSIADQFVTLRAEGNTDIATAELRSDAFVQDRTRPGQGLQTITLESDDPEADFTLSGNLETVLNKTPNSTLNIAMGTVDHLTIDEAATGSTLNLDINSTAMTLNLDTGTTVTGVGDIDDLFVNSAGSNIEMLPDTITIRPGLTASIAGETMNAVQAQESSADPRLLAGYPKAKNVAPTSATAVFSANKAGTVYWAVSTTTDGSIGEDELISPTEGNTKALRSGSTPITASNTETTAALTGLTPDGNYYLSAVMVDARDRHSPVKVTSFTTPDNTVPAFNTGYPVVSQNDYDADSTSENRYHIQISAMPNKSCMLYYALYNSGSAAPTAQQFRVGALGQPLRSGVEDATKNVISFLDFGGLEETKTYDLYLCLIDADGSRSSAVRKLTVTTVDGTPPIFQYETPELSGNPLATSIPTRVNVNEAATVYWAAVRHGNDFIKASDPAGTLAETIQGLSERELETLKRKVESGSGSLSNGSQAVRANIDAAVNITRLVAETAYDIYYVAKDTAGNYSEIKVLDDVHTLDTTPPSVTQRFSRMDERDNPYANTDIELCFSENIQRYPSRTVLIDGVSVVETLLAVRDDPARLADFLSHTVFLYNDSGDDPSAPLETRSYVGDTASSDDWIIDFRKATVSMPNPDSSEVVVTLSSNGGALNLKSGSTYHFAFDNIQDLSTTPNRLPNSPYSLAAFRTVAAQVTLRKDVSASTLTYKDPDPDGTSHSGVDVDMAFSLRPTSINVEDNVLWDLLFWSDSTVDFDLYFRERTAGASEWAKVPATGAANSAITISPNSDEYVAKSLFAHFKQANQPQQTNMLGADKIYEYAIHFTKVGDSTDRGAWNQDINFRVTAVAADTAQALANLTNSTGGITAFAYARAQRNEGVLEINTTDNDSDYFSLFKSFSDSSAPVFTQGHPTFTPQDTSVAIRVMTDRPGTVYYVVAPFSETDDDGNAAYSADVPPTPYWSGSIGSKKVSDTDGRLIAYFQPGSGVTYTDLSDPAKLADYVLSRTNLPKIYEPTTVTGSETPVYPNIPERGTGLSQEEFLVTRPTISMIYNPNFGSSRVRSGSLHVTGSGVQTVNVTGLDPSTSYYVYFVTQGDGQAVYSDYPSLFQFRTAAEYRPDLRVQQTQTSTVDITSRNMDSTINYAIFQMDDLSSSILGYSFKNSRVVGTDENKLAAIDTYLNNQGYTSPAQKSGYTVYQAIQDMYNDATSVFDQFALEGFKSQVANLANGTISNSLRFAVNTIDLEQGATRSVDCVEEHSILPIVQYYFLVTGRYRNIGSNPSANSISFRGASPVFQTDRTTPKLVSITGDVYISYDAAGKLTVDGENSRVYMVFDKDLYYYNTATDRPAIHLYANAGGETGDLTINSQRFKQVSELALSRNNLSFVTAASNRGSTTRLLNLQMSGTTGMGNITLKTNLASQSSQPLSTTISLTVDALNYDTSTGLASVTFTGPGDIWQSGQNIAIYSHVSDVPVRNISLSSPTLTLSTDSSLSNYTQQLTANVLPANASDRDISWSIGAGSSGSVRLNKTLSTAGEAITVTGVSSGTVVLTATVGTGSSAKSAECTIIVQSAPTLSISGDSSIARGSTGTLTAFVERVTGDYVVSWVSSNTGVAMVDAFGETVTVRPVSAGTATITARVLVNNSPVLTKMYSITVT